MIHFHVIAHFFQFDKQSLQVIPLPFELSIFYPFWRDIDCEIKIFIFLQNNTEFTVFYCSYLFSLYNYLSMYILNNLIIINYSWVFIIIKFIIIFYYFKIVFFKWGFWSLSWIFNLLYPILAFSVLCFRNLTFQQYDIKTLHIKLYIQILKNCKWRKNLILAFSINFRMARIHWQILKNKLEREL